MVKELGTHCYNIAFDVFNSMPVEEKARFAEYQGKQVRLVEKMIIDQIHEDLESYARNTPICSFLGGFSPVYFRSGEKRRYTRFDPLDGTDNALAGVDIAGFAMSITEETRKEPHELRLGDFVNGFIGNLPNRKRIFYKTVENDASFGTDFDGEYILHTSGARDTKDGVICFDAFSPKSTENYNPEALAELYLILTKEFRDLFRPRSAVFEVMSMLAPPNHEPYVIAYVAPSQKTENVAASIPVIKGAGGIVAYFDGSSASNHPIDERLDIVIAANEAVLERVLNVMERYNIRNQ